MSPLAPLLGWIDLFGIAVFAASGALAAAQRRQTLVTFAFFALVTGVGGGTVRDLLIDAPVFWVRDWRVAAVCLFTALLIWVTPQRWWSARALDWFDAVGLAAYAVFGAAKALAFGVPPVVAVLMGVITACVGGIIRDVLAGEPAPPRTLRHCGGARIGAVRAARLDRPAACHLCEHRRPARLHPACAGNRARPEAARISPLIRTGISR